MYRPCQALLGPLIAKGKINPLPVVETVTVAFVAVEPFNEIVLGEIEHVDCAGAPLQLRETLLANPPEGETLNV